MPKYRRGSGSVYLKRGWCYIKYYANGEPISEATGTKNKAEARRILQARLGSGQKQFEPLLSWGDSVIPFAMKMIAFKVDGCQLLVGHLQARCILVGIQGGSDAQAGLGGSVPN